MDPLIHSKSYLRKHLDLWNIMALVSSSEPNVEISRKIIHLFTSKDQQRRPDGIPIPLPRATFLDSEVG